jgi:hypothetical protein
MSLDELKALLEAMNSKAWPLVAGLLIGMLVRAAKSPWLGGFFLKIPKDHRFLVPIALGILAGISESLLAGVPWYLALLYGLAAGLLPIAGDKVLTHELPALAGGGATGTAETPPGPGSTSSGA